MARQVFANTLASLTGNTGSLVIGLVITPYLIVRLGLATYGFWAVVSSLVLYVGVMDLGLETTFVKCVAEYAVTGQRTRVRQVVTFGVYFYVMLSVLLGTLATLAAPLVIRWMRLPPDLAAQGPRVLGFVVGAYFLSSAAGVIGSLLSGLGYLRIVSLATFISRVAYGTAAVVLCALHFGIDALVAATFVQTAVLAVCCYAAARRLFGAIFSNPLRLERRIIKRLFSLGGWIQLSNLSSSITMETNRLLIAIFVQVSGVTYYEIANKLARAVRALPLNFIMALLPAVSALDAAGQSDSLNGIYVRASRYVNCATVAGIGLLIAAASPIVRLWMGRDYPGVPTIIAVVGIAYIAINLTVVGTTVLRAIGMPRYESYYMLCWAAVSVGVMAALAPRYGMAGILVGILSGAVSSSAFFLWLFHRLRRLPFVSGFAAWFAPLAAAVCCSIAGVWAVGTRLPPFGAGRGGAFAATVVDALAYSLIFVAALVLLRYFNADDLALFRRVLPGVLHKAPAAPVPIERVAS